MSDETSTTTEPAVPLTVPQTAALPVDAYASLLDLAKRDWPQLQEPGARVAIDITERRDLQITAVLTMADWDLGVAVKRHYFGDFSGGVFVGWTPGRRSK